MIEMLIRVGHHGDGFRPQSRRPQLAKVHGGTARHRSRAARAPASRGREHEERKIELAPSAIVATSRACSRCMASSSSEMLLIGRRNLRTSNSFMHNLPALVKGPERCTLQISPDDARTDRPRRRGERTSH